MQGLESVSLTRGIYNLVGEPLFSLHKIELTIIIVSVPREVWSSFFSCFLIAPIIQLGDSCFLTAAVLMSNRP